MPVHGDGLRGAGIGRRAFLRGAAGLAVLAVTNLPAAPAAAATSRLARHHGPGAAAAWLRTLYRVVAAEALTPPAAARAYACCAVAMYEALLPSMPQHRSLAGQLNALEPVPGSGPGVALDPPAVLAAAVLATAQRV
ncbi:MAG: hypothetical protein M3P93_11375, partial [Actinomycetota bacterium]|nr:hypothetical protein [Actinomycetota bacterium]